MRAFRHNFHEILSEFEPMLEKSRILVLSFFLSKFTKALLEIPSNAIFFFLSSFRTLEGGIDVSNVRIQKQNCHVKVPPEQDTLKEPEAERNSAILENKILHPIPAAGMKQGQTIHFEHIKCDAPKLSNKTC